MEESDIMKGLPGAIFVVDPEEKEYIAVREARKLNIPIVGIVDTNCDPDISIILSREMMMLFGL